MGRCAGELHHRGEVVLSRDLSRLADAVRRRRKIIGGDLASGDRRRVDLLQTEIGKSVTALSPSLERLVSRRTGDPDVG